MRRRAGTIVAGVLVSVTAVGCGVRAEGQPEILRTPPPPTATPSSTEQPTETPSATVLPTATPTSPAIAGPTSTSPQRLMPSMAPGSP